MAIFFLVPIAVPPEYQELGRYLAFALVSLSAGHLLRGLATGLGEYAVVNGERVLQSLARLGLVLVLFLMGWLTVATASGVAALAPLVGLPLLLVATRRHIRRIGPASAEVAQAGRKYAMSAFGATLAHMATQRFDQVIIAAVSSSTQLGYYAVAVPIAELPTLARHALRSVYLAEYSRHLAEEELELRAVRVSLLLAVLIAVPIVFLSPLAIPSIFGGAFQGSIAPTQILAIGSIFFLIMSSCETILQAGGQPGAASVLQGSVAIVSLLGSLVATRHFGAVGAAWAACASYLIGSITGLMFTSRRIGWFKPMLIIPRWDDRIALRVAIQRARSILLSAVRR